jgi:hypothetical protein
MRIYIPSRGRAHLVRTWNNLPTGHDAVMVVPPAETKNYRDAGYMVLPCPAKGIGPTRQWICDQHDLREGKQILMLDDDLEFFVRRMDEPTKVVKANNVFLNRMLKATISTAKAYAHGGIAVREGCNRNTAEYMLDTRCLRALFYDVAVMRKHNVRFDRVPVMEDFDVALQLLRLGYHSATINRWVQDQPGSNTAGGCSLYRTADVQAKGARGLAKLHPGFVTVVEKPALKSGGWNGEPRLDVRVQWKKAFNNAR